MGWISKYYTKTMKMNGKVNIILKIFKCMDKYQNIILKHKQKVCNG